MKHISPSSVYRTGTELSESDADAGPPDIRSGEQFYLSRLHDGRYVLHYTDPAITYLMNLMTTASRRYFLWDAVPTAHCFRA